MLVLRLIFHRLNLEKLLRWFIQLFLRGKLLGASLRVKSVVRFVFIFACSLRFLVTTSGGVLDGASLLHCLHELFLLPLIRENGPGGKLSLGAVSLERIHSFVIR